jgi:hypothetical protein
MIERNTILMKKETCIVLLLSWVMFCSIHHQRTKRTYRGTVSTFTTLLLNTQHCSTANVPRTKKANENQAPRQMFPIQATKSFIHSFPKSTRLLRRVWKDMAVAAVRFIYFLSSSLDSLRNRRRHRRTSGKVI